MINIGRIGLAALLSLYLGCAKQNFRDTGQLHKVEEEEQNKEDIMSAEGCKYTFKKTIRLKNKKLDVLLLAYSYRCDTPKDVKEDDEYITDMKEYYIISNGLKNGELNEDENVCVEDSPYITMIRLNNDEKIYLIDEGRDGEYEVILKLRFDMSLDKAVDLIGLPNPTGNKCYERVLVRK